MLRAADAAAKSSADTEPLLATYGGAYADTVSSTYKSPYSCSLAGAYTGAAAVADASTYSAPIVCSVSAAWRFGISEHLPLE